MTIVESAPPLAPVIVGVGDGNVATGQGSLVTYALGSCLGVCVYDPEAGVAGLLHVMLPSSLDGAEATVHTPARFVDTGVPLLFRACYQLGARKERMIVKVVGGAHQALREEDDHFQIGKRNVRALRQLLSHNNVTVTAEDIGGSRVSRTVRVDAATGRVYVRANGRDYLL